MRHGAVFLVGDEHHREQRFIAHPGSPFGSTAVRVRAIHERVRLLVSRVVLEWRERAFRRSGILDRRRWSAVLT